MLFLEILLFLVAAAGAGYAFARWLPMLAAPGAAGWGEELRALKLERDRLRVELDEARREPAVSDAVDARVEHLKSAVRAAKRRIAELEEAQRMIAAVSSDPANGRPAGLPPERLEAPRGPADDLKRITGIGPNIERKLNEMGIFHFWQIADLDDANVSWLEAHLPIRGRVHRQNWIGQARLLAGLAAEEAASKELEPAP